MSTELLETYRGFR